MAPIMGSLPRSFWPHDVVVWIRSYHLEECTRRRPLRGIRRNEGKSTVEIPIPSTLRKADEHHGVDDYLRKTPSLFP